MSMKHKAFVFNHRNFLTSLQPILEGSLTTQNADALVLYVNHHLSEVRDPYEGEPLDEHWEELLESRDVDEVGDFALTQFYNPKFDIGLYVHWERIAYRLEQLLGTRSPVLGRTIGPPEHHFDPGRQGSYFQSEEDVRMNLRRIDALQDDVLVPLTTLLGQAASQGRGLYVTF